MATWADKWELMSTTDKIENAIKNIDDDDGVGARENLVDLLRDIKNDNKNSIYGEWEIDALIVKLKIQKTRGFNKVVITKEGCLNLE